MSFTFPIMNLPPSVRWLSVVLAATATTIVATKAKDDSKYSFTSQPSSQLNVLDSKLELCSVSPMTGFYRTGSCETGPNDTGVHVVCAQLTQAFLNFTAERGNNLAAAGLKDGDRWCLCALRWREALESGNGVVVPKVHLPATNKHALAFVTKSDLTDHSLAPTSNQ